MFKEERDQSQFEWSMLGDLKEGRPNLGPMTHVAVYRLMQFTLRDILIRDFGVEKADRVFFEAGKQAGQAILQERPHPKEGPERASSPISSAR